jgi:hypothetical protein
MGRLEDNIKMELNVIEWEGVDWVNLDYDRELWEADANTVMKFCVRKMRPVSWLPD